MGRGAALLPSNSIVTTKYIADLGIVYLRRGHSPKERKKDSRVQSRGSIMYSLMVYAGENCNF